MRAAAPAALTPFPLCFNAPDGQPLNGTLRSAPEPHAAVVIAGAMGVHHRYYGAFADFLAERGFAVLTFDYRGIGASQKTQTASVHAWGERDLPAALSELRGRFPGLRTGVVCHSVGGQLVGLMDRGAVDAALMVGSQMGYWKLWRGWKRLAMWAVWHVGIPASIATLGYVPMKRFGQGEDLPRGVGEEWARWGRNPEYVLSYARAHGKLDGYARFDRPLRAISISDDGYAPPATVKALFDAYGTADKELKVVTPASIGAREIGHFGFFRPMFRDALWTDSAEWLSTTLRRA